ncbi:hypothetical protein OKW35_006933 [Paraburkholderia sp. MM5477-R1]
MQMSVGEALTEGNAAPRDGQEKRTYGFHRKSF